MEKKGMFENTGIMIDGIITTFKTKPSYEDKFTILKDIIQNGEVTEEFYINEEDLGKWFYLKGAKKEMRKNAQGFEYNYSEGGMIFNLCVPQKGRAFRSNLLFFKEKNKRISSSIPNAT